MRLHRITLTAIGPFAGTEDIDLDALAADGLFLLEGPTGAGKSTILDALTFAFYDGVAGAESDKHRMHSDFAEPTAEPQVVVEFSVRGDRHRITRVPKHERAKKRGTGTTTQNGRAHLERFVDGAWTTVSADRKDIGVEIGDLLGLTKDQFTQVVLLPQGEFATFLRAGDDDRRALLTKLFGTRIYDTITERLENERREAGAQRRKAADAVAIALSVAMEAAGREPIDREEALELGTDERAALLAEIDAALGTTVRTTAAEVTAAIAARDTARTTSDAAQTTLRNVERHRELVRRRDEHESTRPQHEKRMERLDAARRAEPVRALLATLADADAAVTDAERAWCDAVEALPADAQAHADDRDGLVARATADLELAASLEHLVTQEAELATHQATLAAGLAALTEAESNRESLSAALSELPEREEAARTELTAATALAAQVEPAERAVTALTERLRAARELVALREKLVDAVATRHAAELAVAEATTLHQELQDSRFVGIAGELATRLVSGEPCVVCGSDAHPRPASTSAVPVTDEALREARHARDAAEVARTAAEDTERTLHLDISTLAAAAGPTEPDTLQAELVDATAAAAEARAAHDALDGLTAAVASLNEERARIERELTTAREQVTELATTTDALRRNLVDQEAALVTARGEHPSVAARQGAVRARGTAASAAADALAMLDHARSDLVARRTAVSTEATERGFTDPEAARRALLDTDATAALAAEIAAFDSIVAELRGALAEPALVEAAELDLDAARDRASAARDALTAGEDACVAAEKVAAAAAARRDRFTARRADLDTAAQTHDTVLADTAAVVRLAGLANGTTGHRPMNLTTYVLRERFHQVVEAANLRLATMSDGRYELRRTDGPDKRRGGLTLVVLDRWTGDERAPASLSGGETFFTSLALALGLADVVKSEAGGVELDTLFVDEGFGSLDPETLEKVMDVIDDLRDRGRAVGVVSHVTELKERIPQRLEIIRKRDGTSTTRVLV